ncbi:riboflavin kinase [Neobacillus vireti]|uniref:riboflavin kinase n=1 Tax=Neobacillus vireti TaxID=220686 RepID=UPI003000DAF3
MQPLINFQNDIVTGIVVQGKQLGRTIGYPTANIEPYKLVDLPKGVYGVYVYYGEKLYMGVMNVGERPSFNDGNHITYEVHILDFNDDLYGKELSVEFAFYVRNEQKFSSLPDLIQQLNKDARYTANRRKKALALWGRLHA